MPDPKSQDAPAQEPIRRYKVMHGAVSGFEPDPKRPGRTRERDYHLGSIITAEQLGGDDNVAQYLVRNAIQPIE